MRSFFFLMKCNAVLTTILAAQDFQELTVRRLNPSTIEVDFRPKIWNHDIMTPEGTRMVRFDFYRAQTGHSEQGSLIVPFRAVALELPSKEFSLRILDVEERVLEGVVHAGAPRFEADQQFGQASVFEPAQMAPTSPRIPTALAEIVDFFPTTSGYSGTLKLYPVVFESARNTTRLHSRIRLVIECSGPGRIPGGSIRKSPEITDSPLSQGEWYKMDVQETGIYRLDQSFFSGAGIPLSSVAALQTIRIFGNGGEELPENLTSPRPNGLQEIPRFVVDRNGNGIFDLEDFLLFYGRPTRGWKYNASTSTFSHTLNHYTETNQYFITFGGLAGRGMDSVASLNQPAPYVVSSFQGRQFIEEERSNLINSGREWVGQLFDSENRVAVYATALPGYFPQFPVTYRFVVLARSTASQSFKFDESGDFLGRIITSGFNITSIENNYAYRSPATTFVRGMPVPGSRSVLRIEFEVTESGSQGWLDWAEIFYRQSFDAVADLLLFTSPDTSATVEYNLRNFSSGDISVYDVSDHQNPTRVVGLQFDTADPSRVKFQLVQSAGSVREMIAVGPLGFKVPANVRRVENTNLQGIAEGAALVIIAPREFRGEANRLKDHREKQDSLKTLVANVEDVFNEFSGGLPDPIAIRDFLFQASQSWQTKPRYVLLFGNGHYDYKNIRTTARNWIPPYESLESIHQIDSHASDDHFAFLNPGDTRVSLGIGRIPATSLEEARAAVDRIISYETASPLNPWRNRVTFVADDGLTSVRDDGNIHTYQAEILAQFYTPPSIERKKIYIIEYPTVNSASGRRKPAANNAIIDAINGGTMIINYTGHGNPQLWAHEAIFTRETSLPQLTNRDMLTFLVAATCDFARYDNPAERSAGEEILFLERGGAIGVITASRAVYSFENSQFNNTLYSELFRRDPDGMPPRLGDALFRTKQVHYSTNDLKYHLFADPSMRLAAPRSIAAVDSVNGNPLGSVVSVQALGLMSVAGGILKPTGTPWADFNGRAFLEVFDSKRRVIIAEWGNYSFEKNGSLLYRGEVTVRDGAVRATLPIPKDVSYDNNRARISLYAWNNSSDAVGFTDQVIIAGTDSSTVNDGTGPQMEVFLGDENFRSGDFVPQGPLLIVKLQDQNGINTSTAGIGHRLEATIGRSATPIDLTDYYRSDLDTYQSGEVRYPLRGLPEGRQLLSVKAWDIHNNSSQEEVSFEVRSSSSFAISNLYNFPNPVSRSTVFTFQRSSVEPIDVEVKIYTLAGRLIERLTAAPVVERFVQIQWDGKDGNGDEVANGVYFYKVVARSLTGKSSTEAIGRLTMLR